MTKAIDQEYIYKLVLRKEWAELLDYVHKHRAITEADELINSALRTFEEEFFIELDKGDRANQGEELLTKLFLLHRGRIFSLSESHFIQVVVRLVSLYNQRQNIQLAYEMAKLFPNEPICRSTIQEYEATLPQTLIHSQSKKIDVIQNSNISANNYSTSLFKSSQERYFFFALRRIYPRYDVYPNVALSSIINYKEIEQSLTKEEKDYYFKGILDSVVFDQFDDYRPLHCFELDSLYHNSIEQKLKDNYKDKILASAGLKLFRIRGIAGNPSESEFMTLIREIIEN